MFHTKFLSQQLFETLRKERPQELNKIIPIVGDITEPELGISPPDQAMLCQKVRSGGRRFEIYSIKYYIFYVHFYRKHIKAF